MVYYGLGFNSGNLAGNYYVNFALSGLVEIPAYIMAGYLVERWVVNQSSEKSIDVHQATINQHPNNKQCS